VHDRASSPPAAWSGETGLVRRPRDRRGPPPWWAAWWAASGLAAGSG